MTSCTPSSSCDSDALSPRRFTDLEVTTLLRHGATYHLRIVHQGARVQVFLDGNRIIDRTDPAAAHTDGHVGLNVFGGRAGYQDTYAKEL